MDNLQPQYAGGDPLTPETCAQALENSQDDYLTEADYVRWLGQKCEALERIVARRGELLREAHVLNELAMFTGQHEDAASIKLGDDIAAELTDPTTTGKDGM